MTYFSLIQLKNARKWNARPAISFATRQAAAAAILGADQTCPLRDRATPTRGSTREDPLKEAEEGTLKADSLRLDTRKEEDMVRIF